MQSTLSRRELLAAAGIWAASYRLGCSQPTSDETLTERIRGLLLGSMIGDALGGPIEFQKSSDIADRVIKCRAWPDDRRLTDADLRDFTASLEMTSYAEFRPKAEPYGQWRENALPGTVTDDTRHKMVLISALKTLADRQPFALTAEDLAQAYLDFAKHPAIDRRPEYRQLCDESFREFCLAARWVLGERELDIAAPPDRIWAGTPTCCGQMTMPPLAAIYAGRPVEAYRATYEASFFDVGTAKDINASIVAGLSVALQIPQPKDVSSRKAAWQKITDTMRTTDPYRYAKVPFAARPTTDWLERARKVAKDANGKPKQLYELLLKRGHVRYFWESHFILLLVFATIEFCGYDPLAALAVTLDFGHDTDSGAQLLGAFAGALYGPQLFSADLQRPVLKQLADDYDVSLDDWVRLLSQLQKSVAA